MYKYSKWCMQFKFILHLYKNDSLQNIKQCPLKKAFLTKQSKHIIKQNGGFSKWILLCTLFVFAHIKRKLLWPFACTIFNF